MRINARNTEEIMVDGRKMEEVNEFKYLGSIVTVDGDVEKEINTRIGIAAAAFRALDNIWRSSAYKIQTKLNIYKSNVRSVLLYGAETWKTSTKTDSRTRGFEGRCLRRILRIRWDQRVTNTEVFRRTGINNINDEIKKRRWKWLGHTLRMQNTRHPRMALTWNPGGKRARGRPRETWRRTIERERADVGKTWNELNWLAQDRSGWRKFVDALCFKGG